VQLDKDILHRASVQSQLVRLRGWRLGITNVANKQRGSNWGACF